MKHYRKYPYGILIKPVQSGKYKDSCDPLFEISDDNNQRQRVRLSQLYHLAYTNQYSIAGYPRATIITNTSSRNQFVKNKDGVYCKVYNGRKAGGGKKSYSIPPLDNTARYAKFTVVQTGKEHPLMEYKGSDIRVPILPDETSTAYYGRPDARVYSTFDIAEPLNIDKET